MNWHDGLQTTGLWSTQETGTARLLCDSVYVLDGGPGFVTIPAGTRVKVASLREITEHQRSLRDWSIKRGRYRECVWFHYKGRTYGADLDEIEVTKVREIACN